MVVFRQGGLHIRQDGIRFDSGIEVRLEKGAQRIPILGPEKIEPEISRPDVVGFLDNQVAPTLEPLRRAKEGEADEKT